MDSVKIDDRNFSINYNESLDYCKSILPNVSRSFAIGINFLTGELQKSVLVGYLLCRIIDTIEDDRYLDLDVKKQHLIKFVDCFDDFGETIKYKKIANVLNGDKYHIDLVKNVDKVFHIYFKLSKNSQEILRRWVTEMSKGMALFINRYPLGIRIVSLAEYKEYCYYVAGTVGYLLTELWKEYGVLIDKKSFDMMYKNSAIFGEALQTVNILKDIAWDAKGENSIYIPAEILQKYGVSQETMLNESLKEIVETAVKEIILLAYQDLEISLQYLKSIPKMNFRIRFFCIFPLLLAFATLRKLESSTNIINPERVIKVSRNEVKKVKIYSIFACLFNFLLNIPALKCFKI